MYQRQEKNISQTFSYYLPSFFYGTPSIPIMAAAFYSPAGVPIISATYTSAPPSTCLTQTSIYLILYKKIGHL